MQGCSSSSERNVPVRMGAGWWYPVHTVLLPPCQIPPVSELLSEAAWIHCWNVQWNKAKHGWKQLVWQSWRGGSQDFQGVLLSHTEEFKRSGCAMGAHGVWGSSRVRCAPDVPPVPSRATQDPSGNWQIRKPWLSAVFDSASSYTEHIPSIRSFQGHLTIKAEGCSVDGNFGTVTHEFALFLYHVLLRNPWMEPWAPYVGWYTLADCGGCINKALLCCA